MQIEMSIHVHGRHAAMPMCILRIDVTDLNVIFHFLLMGGEKI